jgi:hypothetical protein
MLLRRHTGEKIATGSRLRIIHTFSARAELAYSRRSAEAPQIQASAFAAG